MLVTEAQLDELPSALYRERAQMPRSGALYVVVSADEQILYIGQTGNLWERMKTHNRPIPDDARIYWMSIAEKADRVIAERASIAALGPIWNGHVWPLQ